MIAPSDCSLCPRLCESRKRVVNGAGPMSALVWFIGQNGGREEEERDEPLVGWSGDRVVEGAALVGLVKLPPEDELKTMDVEERVALYEAARSTLRRDNIVKCRPPRGVGGDEVPTPGEIKKCRHYLLDDLRTPPQMVVTLGAPALKWFSREYPLSVCHGNARHWTHPDTNSSIMYMPMYHPAAAYRGRATWLAPVMREDWRWLGVVLRGEDDQEGFAQHRAVLDKLIY